LLADVPEIKFHIDIRLIGSCMIESGSGSASRGGGHADAVDLKSV
jgi:hypothetical protein